MYFEYHGLRVISSYSLTDRQSSQGVEQAWTTIYQQVVTESGQLLGAVYDSTDASSSSFLEVDLVSYEFPYLMNVVTFHTPTVLCKLSLPLAIICNLRTCFMSLFQYRDGCGLFIDSLDANAYEPAL